MTHQHTVDRELKPRQSNPESILVIKPYNKSSCSTPWRVCYLHLAHYLCQDSCHPAQHRHTVTSGWSIQQLSPFHSLQCRLHESKVWSVCSPSDATQAQHVRSWHVEDRAWRSHELMFLSLCSGMMQWKALEADAYPSSLDMDLASSANLDYNVHILRSFFINLG